MTQNTAPQAGWYPDPQNPSVQFRWWDGGQWTDNTSPMHQQAQVPAVQAQHTPPPAPVSPVTQMQSLQPVMQTQQQQVVHGTVVDPRFDFDQFVIKQKIRPLLNTYDISAPKKGGVHSKQPTHTTDICNVRQKRAALRERISIKDAGDRELLYLQSQKILDVHGTSDIYDEHGTLLGRMKKDFKASLLRSRWQLLSPSHDQLAVIEEKSMLVAVLRRIGRLHDVLNLIMTFVPYGFNITAGTHAPTLGVAAGTLVGTHNRRIGLRDHYDLDLRQDHSHIVDRRVAVMMAVALDCLQNR